MMTFPIYGKIKHVPNHQPDIDIRPSIKLMVQLRNSTAKSGSNGHCCRARFPCFVPSDMDLCLCVHVLKHHLVALNLCVSQNWFEELILKEHQALLMLFDKPSHSDVFNHHFVG